MIIEVLEVFLDLQYHFEKKEKKRKKKFADNTVAFVGAFSGFLTTRPLARCLRSQHLFEKPGVRIQIQEMSMRLK